MEEKNQNKTYKNQINTTTEEYLDDVTFIKQINHVKLGKWHQYDVILAARKYGWQTMISWSDYMAQADIENISEVTTGNFVTSDQDITTSYFKNGCKCSETPELKTEKGMLSIAGVSKTIKSPIKIIWINQTKSLRFLTIIDNDLLISKYIETTIRRTFDTEDAMKLGKPLPEQR